MQLSVVIPVYNVERYLAKALSSVLDNDLEDKSFEIIAVDDESPDHSIDILNDFARKHPNVSVISQKNKGLGGARNTGILHAKGKYLLFLDADDWYLPNTIRPLVQNADRQELDILEFGAQGINPDNTIAYSRAINSPGVTDGVHHYQKYRYLDSACNKLYRRDFLVENELLFVEKLYIEDYEFNTRALFRAKRVAATNLIAAQFLQSPESITRTADRAKQLKMQEDIILVIKKISDFYKQQGHSNDPERVNAYFGQRLAFLTATLFYQLLKKDFPFDDIILLKKRLQHEKLFFTDNVIFDRKKEWFRVIFLKHFTFFRLAKGLFRFL